ncbi:hypothetical protein DE146DRAFT_767786 [Phaeosphaeria sp. MPI-PUGE-AT-0046c]|nr:hypothetical protein DE146DRAFT_767786 [Phaeosphaeria sp. MPI-PUGE-AT-0046c]
MAMEPTQLPVKDCLGRIIDCTKHDVNMFSPSSVLNAGNVIEAITWSADDKGSHNGHTYTKPGNVVVIFVNSEVSTFVFADSGSKVLEELRTDATISGRYMAVSAKVGVNYAYKGNFSEDMQYGFLNNSSNVYTASLLGNGMATWKHVTPDVQNAILALPTTLEGNHAQFDEFAAAWGTHLITQATFGTRFEYTIKCSQTAVSSGQEMKAFIEAEYGTAVVGAGGSVSVKASKEFQTYQKYREAKALVVGGDPSLAGALRSDPSNPSRALAWASSDRSFGNEALVHMDTIPLGELLVHSTDAHQKSIGQALNDYINFKIGVRMIPISKDLYGPVVVAWSPPGGVGHVIIRFKSDPQARFTDVKAEPGSVDVLDHGQALKFTFDAHIDNKPTARVFNAIYVGIECGKKTDIEFSGEGMIGFAINQNVLGERNLSSPYNFHAVYKGYKGAAPHTTSNVDLCSKGTATDLKSLEPFKIEPKDIGRE